MSADNVGATCEFAEIDQRSTRQTRPHPTICEPIVAQMPKEGTGKCSVFQSTRKLGAEDAALLRQVSAAPLAPRDTGNGDPKKIRRPCKQRTEDGL